MLSRLNFQFLALVALVFIASIYETVMAWYGVQTSKAFNYLSTATFSYIVAWWVETDRKKRGISAPFEYAAFMFFLWPILAPYYLFKTRSWKGLGLGVGLIFLTFVPVIIAIIVLMIFGE